MKISHFIPGFTIQLLKRFMDIIGGLFGTFLFLCLYPLVACFIRWDTKGPIIYRQERVGVNRRSEDRRMPRGHKILAMHDRRNSSNNRRKQNVCGNTFQLYKFRTMRMDAELNGPQLCATHGDNRITRIGKILRWFHIDELPQFYNVLKGDMSLIGPRPERPHFTEKYAQEIPHYEERHRYIKPGITGLAQITLGYDESLQTVNYKYYYDITYRISLTSIPSWLRMETWIYYNTVKYLAYQLIQAVENQIHAKIQKVKTTSIDSAKRNATIAHPFKMIYHIHKRNQISDPESVSFRAQLQSDMAGN